MNSNTFIKKSIICSDESLICNQNNEDEIYSKDLLSNIVNELHLTYVAKYEKSKFSKYMYDYQQKSVCIDKFIDNIFYFLTEISDSDLIITLKKIK